MEHADGMTEHYIPLQKASVMLKNGGQQDKRQDGSEKYGVSVLHRLQPMG